MTARGLDARTASLTTALLDQVDPGHQPEGPTGAQLLGVQHLGCATLALGVITGLQERFDWRGVAASSVGAGVGEAVAPGLACAFGLDPMGQFASRMTTGLEAGTAAAVMRGGKVAIQQVAVDAFGNALGSSLADQMFGLGQQGVGPWSGGDYINEMDRASDNFNPTSLPSYRNGMDIESDNATTQRRRDVVYGFSTGSSGLGLKADGGVWLSYAGMRAVPAVADDTRVFSDSRNPFKSVPVGQDGLPTAQLIVPPGLVGAGEIVGGGSQVVRPAGAGVPPPYDLRADKPNVVPGYAMPDIKLGAGMPPLVHGIYSLIGLPADGFARPAQSLVDALGNLTCSLRDPTNGRFVTDPENPPSPNSFTDAQRRTAWKELAQNSTSPLSAAQRAEIQDRGWRGPQRINEYGEVETMELSHEPIPLRDGGTSVVPRWPADHAAVDPYRQLKKRP